MSHNANDHINKCVRRDLRVARAQFLTRAKLRTKPRRTHQNPSVHNPVPAGGRSPLKQVEYEINRVSALNRSLHDALGIYLSADGRDNDVGGSRSRNLNNFVSALNCATLQPCATLHCYKNFELIESSIIFSSRAWSQLVCAQRTPTSWKRVTGWRWASLSPPSSRRQSPENGLDSFLPYSTGWTTRGWFSGTPWRA